MSKKLIYVVEDDYLQYESTVEALSGEFHDVIELRHIPTHQKFLNSLEEIASQQPACIILDVMLPWTDTEMVAEPPSLNSYMTAGIQCLQKLREDPRTKNIPVLIYTVLDRADIAALNTDYLRKDAPDRDLIDWVRRAARLSAAQVY